MAWTDVPASQGVWPDVLVVGPYISGLLITEDEKVLVFENELTFGIEKFLYVDWDSVTTQDTQWVEV